jgi:hypothetical protein
MNKDKYVVYYKSIPAEIKRMGITHEECAELLGCTKSGLGYRITADKPQLHWAIFGLASYLGNNQPNLKRKRKKRGLGAS